MEIVQHFTILVFPFRHNMDDRKRRHLKALDPWWRPWWARLNDRERERALDDSYFFLPYVREMLCPEGMLLSPERRPAPPADLQQLAELSPTQFLQRLPRDAVARLTYAPAELDPWRRLRLEFSLEEDASVFPVRVKWIDLVLSTQGVGFLLINVGLDEEAPTVKRLNDMHYYLRTIQPPSLGWRLAEWGIELPSGPMRLESRDLVDFLLQGCTAGGDGHIRPLAEFAPGARRYTASQEGQVYGEVFRLFSYVCLGESAPARASAAIEGFDKPEIRILYELATCTNCSEPEYIPHPDYLRRLLQHSQIALWKNWQGLALHDNVVFLGLAPDRFTTGALPHNVEHDYFNLYLLVLFQKIRLSMMFGELIRREANLPRNLKEARRLWDAFIRFENHYWFSEVTRKPQGIELYHRFQEGVQVRPLYEEMRVEVRQLRDHYEQRIARHVNSLLNFLTFVGLPAGLLVELFSNALVPKATWAQFFLTAGIAYAGIALLWLLWRWLRRK